MFNSVSDQRTGDGRQAAGGKEAVADKSYAVGPAISVPKGGGALRGIDEKFSVNPATGSATLSVPIFTSPSRMDFYPKLSLQYDSGAGNGPFGLGWSLSVPSIARKTDKGIPKYRDAEDSDVYILSGAEDLVPVLIETGGEWVRDVPDDIPGGEDCTIQRYRPRIEGLFARIERWEDKTSGNVHWRSVSKDNITSIYGRTAKGRISDPEDDSRIFRWLLEESYDDKGNVICYVYKQENKDNVDRSLPQEKNRLANNTGFTNQYLKRIKYGNKKPFEREDWLFELVFDYGDHDPEIPTPSDPHDWSTRSDSFSTYRAGFEVRTYRLCRRALMFHHIEELGVEPYLVRSTEFGFTENPVVTYLTDITQTGYVRKEGEDGYITRSLPPLEFTCTEVRVDETVHFVDRESLENLPIGLDGSRYQWVDLDGEGVSGILTEQGREWFYKRNLGNLRFDPAQLATKHPPDPPTPQETGPVRFGPTRVVASQPSLANLQGGQQQIMDLAGDGKKDLVLLSGPVTGFYERDDGEWAYFTPLESSPNVAWGDPNLRLIDLNGDGHADILVTEDEAFCWYPSEGEQGFGPVETARKAIDDEKGPALVFADASQSVYLADMSGDGLIDITRIRNGEVCYWPNLGYGRFGAKVTMDAAPSFDSPDLFNQNRIQLADIDGSGTTDILYLGRDGVNFWHNQAGNSWSEEPHRLASFPPTDNIGSVMVVDLLGNGTACIVWSSPLPSANGQPLRYIDLMGGHKPHLMESVKNNMGAETRFQYASSTKYYLEDLSLGRPWITRLPFPVHVIERVEARELVTGTKFVTLYRYHHGYFDGEEREFRGFGMVEQWDTESFGTFKGAGLFSEGPSTVEEELHSPPVYTRTWFHTGAYFEERRISKQYVDEYYSDDQYAIFLPDTTLPDELTGEEERQAARALKGQLLRQEIYALDDPPKSRHPYSVSERTYKLKLCQPMREGRHAVFFAYPLESLDYQYERVTEDPRLSHQMTLEVDPFGNLRKSVAIGYPRRAPDPDLSGEAQAAQSRTLITYTENTVANYDETSWYRIGVPIETRTYELTGVPRVVSPPEASAPFASTDIVTAVETTNNGQHEIPYEDPDGASATSDPPFKRLIEHVRTLYYRDDLSAALRLGEVESLSLPYENYKLAFTPGLITEVFESRVNEDKLKDEGKYLKAEDYKILNLFPPEDLDETWWIPSGKQIFDPAQFYVPIEHIDPFGQTFSTTYDDYALLIKQTEDPLNNLVSAENNYRTLQPELVTDPNGNRSQVAFDALGLVVGTAVMGKEGDDKGDSLDGFESDLDEERIIQHIDDPHNRDSGDPINDPHQVLEKATTRLIYDFYREGRPSVVYTVARETHVSDLEPEEKTALQHNFQYTDGIGREVMTKLQAEPGSAPRRDDDGTLKCNENLQYADPRWTGTGRTVYDNKGNPVKKFEPYFSPTHVYEDEPELVECGVTPILHYDPLGRLIRTDMPNGTFSVVKFDAWQQLAYDENDTVLDSDWYADRGAPDLTTPEPADPETRAAWLAYQHADTPTTAHLDTLERVFLTISNNGPGEDYPTLVEMDIEGNQRSVTDAKTRRVMEYRVKETLPSGEERFTPGYDVAGNQLYQINMDAGTRWMLNDVSGSPIYRWDSRNNRVRRIYDELRRPTHLFVKQQSEPEQLVERTVYGEAHPDSNPPAPGVPAPKILNLRGQVFIQLDGAGIITNMGHNPQTNEDEAYDFKGNLLRTTRRFAREYRERMNWSDIEPLLNTAPLGQSDIEATMAPLLEVDTFESSTTYDALNRPLTLTTPDNSLIRPTFNEANLLESVGASLRGAAAVTTFVFNIDYNAKGQRERIEYGDPAGHPVFTEYTYDKDTFRLVHLKTTRLTFPGNKQIVQDLSYTYDPIGNITHIHDEADIHNVVFFKNQRVEPSADYSYDALYRLIRGTGREHLGQTGSGALQPPTSPSHNDAPRVGLPHPGDGDAMGNYFETYEYDKVGNINTVIHSASSGGWTRSYDYNEPSLIEPARMNNRLSATTVGNGATRTANYLYDTHGSMIRMPHFSGDPNPNMHWGFKDQLHQVDLGGGGTAFYVYDGAGQRVRKVIERQNGTRQKERFYLGGFEIYREYNGNGIPVAVERETLHVMDDQRRIALVETKTIDAEETPFTPTTLTRYKHANHLGSAVLELDQDAEVITYEEYYPYGSTSYQAVNSQIEVSRKRHRYTGKERDEESGFYYYGARYYAALLGRWISSDPLVYSTEVRLIQSYDYVRNNPISRFDQDGLLDDEARTILNYLQELANKIPQDEFSDLAPSVQGTRAHLGSEALLSMGGDMPSDINIRRLAAEIQVDAEGVIRAVGAEPGAAKKGWRTIDAAVLKEKALHMPGRGRSGIVGVKASDVIEVAVDYKTGKASMKKAKQMEKLIGAPYVKVEKGGNLLKTVEKKLARTAKGSKKAAGAAAEALESSSKAGSKKVATQGTKQALKSGEVALETTGRRVLRRVLMAIPIIDVAYQQYDYENTAYTGYRSFDAFLNLTIAEVWEVPIAIGTVLWEGTKITGRQMAEADWYPVPDFP